jgi:hypothetical protein
MECRQWSGNDGVSKYGSAVKCVAECDALGIRRVRCPICQKKSDKSVEE